MRGYVVKKGTRFYAVIYEGVDPLTGRERRRWHPAGEVRHEAELLAAGLAAAALGRRSSAGPDVGHLPAEAVAAGEGGESSAEHLGWISTAHRA